MDRDHGRGESGLMAADARVVAARMGWATDSLMGHWTIDDLREMRRLTRDTGRVVVFACPGDDDPDIAGDERVNWRSPWTEAAQ